MFHVEHYLKHFTIIFFIYQHSLINYYHFINVNIYNDTKIVPRGTILRIYHTLLLYLYFTLYNNVPRGTLLYKIKQPIF